MNFNRALVMFTFLTSMLSSFANASIIEGARYGINGNFENNGLITTEYRQDGSVWEWLDLTVTNGASDTGIELDIADDGILNLSSGSYGHAGLRADIRALTAEQATGWSFVSATEISMMFSQFFGVSIVDGQKYQYNSNMLIVENFIELFGDTYHDRFEETAASITDVNLNLANTGYAAGHTSTVPDGYSDTFRRNASVFDGQYANLMTDTNFDHIATDGITTGQSTLIGFWLTRQVSSSSQIPEPNAAYLVLMGLFLLVNRLKIARTKTAKF